MSEDSAEHIPPIPPPDAPMEWLGFSLAVDFYPAIKLTRKIGLEFTASLAEILEPEDVHLEGNEWIISGGGVCEGISLHIGKRYIRVYVSPISTSLERYEQRIATILKVFEETFEPKAALQSNVDVTGLVKLPGEADARAFLGGYVMVMHPSKLDAIDRPLDILGIRLFFPPYEDVDWGVNVRIESCADDPQKVYLNADADWDQQARWDQDFVENLSERVTTIFKFMSERLIQFLREPPFPMTDVEDENDE